MTYKEKWESILQEPINNIQEFLRGELDCKEGEPFKEGQNECYERGYRSRYQLNEMMSSYGGTL